MGAPPPTSPPMDYAPTRTPEPAGGTNPATAQAARARASRDVGALADGTPGTRTDQADRQWWADGPTPTRFPDRVPIPDPVVNSVPNSHLPGRIDPAAWDGETGPAAPNQIGTW